ncbi:MAG: NAD(+) diphosphatase [Woeseia sp.]
MPGHNVFAGAFVDRSAHRRHDAAWLEAALAQDGTVFVPVWGDRCLVTDEPHRTVLLKSADLAAFGNQLPVFLGMYRDQPAFAVHINRAIDAPFADRGTFHDLRYLGSVLPADEANLVAHARALLLWHEAQQYCGRCGTETLARAAGNTRVCQNGDCGAQIFPRVDPAIIVLVHDGESCLLGRQAKWPEGRYSTIAGFVEPGESLEDAVIREVQEETNVAVSNVRYHSSQPWPFPASLMLGFHARGDSRDIELNDGELEDAQWFTRKELASGYPKLPPRLSIARRLLDDWIEDDELAPDFS